MIDVSPIQTFDHKLSWETEIIANLQCLFINIFC